MRGGPEEKKMKKLSFNPKKERYRTVEMETKMEMHSGFGDGGCV